MMASSSTNYDFIDFYIKYQGHPRFDPSQIMEDEVLNIILQKYEMILYTNKGELLGEPDFGGDLELLLHETKVSSTTVETNLHQQIQTYITELANINYTLDVQFIQDPDNYQDMMYIYFKISELEVNAIIS
jgi:hypothetical protein